MNGAAILLTLLGTLLFGITILLALVLLAARKISAARITLAGGLLDVAITASLATLSYLEPGMGYRPEGAEHLLVITALILLLTGAGQFIAALRSSRTYGVTIACAAISLVFLATGVSEFYPEQPNVIEQILGSRSLSPPSISVGMAVSLLLAVIALVIPLVAPHRRNAILLKTAMIGCGFIAGLAAAEFGVTTHATMVSSRPGERQDVRVAVEVLGFQVSDAAGLARIPARVPNYLYKTAEPCVRAATPAQALWLYGPPILGSFLGLIVALTVGKLRGARCAD